MTYNFKPFVTYSDENIDELRGISSFVDPIFDCLKNPSIIDELGDQVAIIEYHLLNILMIKRLMDEDIDVLHNYIYNPETATNFQLQKLVRYLFINFESALDALNKACLSNKKINNLEFDVRQFDIPDFKALRNHSVHEGFFGILRDMRPSVEAHNDVFTPPTETRGFYIVDDNGEKSEFTLSQVRPQFYYPIHKSIEGFLEAILKLLMRHSN
jgi:hypothetical protein